MFKPNQRVKFKSTEDSAQGITAHGYVIRLLDSSECDPEVGNMYLIGLDGAGGLVIEWHAFEDELSKEE